MIAHILVLAGAVLLSLGFQWGWILIILATIARLISDADMRKTVKKLEQRFEMLEGK
jgi:hypothetical protein